MNDVPPISPPYAIQLNDEDGYFTEFWVEFTSPVRTVAMWHGDVASRNDNVLHAGLFADGVMVTEYDFFHSKDTARFIGIIAIGDDWFNGVWFISYNDGDNWGFDNFEFEYIVPEPASMTPIALFGIGALAIRRRK